jgi:hypothetical protein
MKRDFVLLNDLLSTSEKCKLEKLFRKLRVIKTSQYTTNEYVKILHLGSWWFCIYNLYSSYVRHILPLKYTVEVFNGLAMFKATAQSIQRLIVDNTHALESVLTFRGQLKTVTPTDRPSKALPRCQQVRLPSLVPIGVLCSTRRHIPSSTIKCLQACIILNSTMLIGIVSSATLKCLQACIIVKSAMFAGIVSSSTLQWLQALYHRQLCNIHSDRNIVNCTVFTGIVSSTPSFNPLTSLG